MASSRRGSSSAMSRSIAGVAGRQAIAQLLVVGAQQALVLLVAHRVDPRAQGVAPVVLEERAQAPPVLDGLGVPACRLEHPHEAPGGDVGHDAVQRLAVEVDDPEHLAEARHHRVDDRLPHRALVQLGVAQQRDLAPAAGHLEVPGDVAMGQRAPDRRGGPDADAPGRIVDGVGILRAARIGLKAPVLAQPRQVRRVQAAEQEVDRVQDRRGVGLDRDAVGRARGARTRARS